MQGLLKVKKKFKEQSNVGAPAWGFQLSIRKGSNAFPNNVHIWKGNLQIYSFSSTLTGTALTTVLPFVVRKLNLWLHNFF